MPDPDRPPLACPFTKVFPSQLVRDDVFFMALAYNQAIDAWREDEVPVGAVIACDGEVIAAAHNQVDRTRDPTAHAEILALTQAARHLGNWRLSGATLLARLERVVYALADPKMGCLGGATDLNALPQVNHHLTVTRGVMEAECRELLQAFFRLKRAEPDAS